MLPENRLNKPRTILVTGGLGFIGSHFVEKALECGHTVINYDMESYAANLDLQFTGNYSFRQCAIEEIKEITKLLWKVISKSKKKEVIDSLNNKNYEKAAKIILSNYYDPLYQHTLKKKKYLFEVNNDILEEAAKIIGDKISSLITS